MVQGGENTYQNDLNLVDYLFIIRFHLKKLIFIILIGILATLYNTYSKPPVYQATSSVIVREKPGTSMVMNFGGDNRRNRMTGEIQLIKSRSVAYEVIKRFWNSDRRNRMNLFGTRQYYPKGANVRKNLKEILSLGMYEENEKTINHDGIPYSKEIGDKYANTLIGNISVKAQGSTDILLITYKSVIADEARRVANMIAYVYKDLEKDLANQDANLSVLFLNDLVNKQEENLFDAEEEIKKFKINNKMYDLDGNANQITSQLSSIESELYNNRAEISIRKEKISFLNSKLSESEKNLAKKISSDINVQMSVLRAEINTLESQLIQNTTLYGKEHGAVKQLQSKIEGLKVQLDNKVNDLIDRGITVKDPLEYRQENIANLLSLESEIFGLELRKEETVKLQDIYIEKLKDLPDKQLEFSRLKRNEVVLNQNYTMVRQKLEEAKIQLASRGGKVQVLDEARRPKKPISPNHQQDIILGIILSFIAGMVIIVLIEFFDFSIRSADDIGKFGLTILGIIPSIGESMNQGGKNAFLNKYGKTSKTNSKNMKRRLITREDPRSPVSEAYRSLRTSLLYASADKKTKSILVSSAGPGEGKTTTVANMAITYANLGKKTLLIDTDLRRPVVHKVLDLKKDPGITNYLAGATDDFDGLVQQTDIDNLSVVTSGLIPPNPSELLGSNKMSSLVKKLEETWDIILFDSPPLVAVTDATMISKEIDKIVIVVKVGQTDKKAFEHTINSLTNVNAPLGGVVLNAVTHKNSYGSYYYYYQYYHYYGSDKDKS